MAPLSLLGDFFKSVAPSIGLGFLTGGTSFLLQGAWAAALKAGGITTGIHLLSSLGAREDAGSFDPVRPRTQTFGGVESNPALYVVGMPRLEGIPAFLEQRGIHLHVAYSMSEGECDGIEDGDAMFIDGIKHIAREVTGSPGEFVAARTVSRSDPDRPEIIFPDDVQTFEVQTTVRFWVYKAADGAEGDSLRDQTSVTSTEFLNGVTWIHLRISQTHFGYFKHPPKVEFVLRGMKINAPRYRATFEADFNGGVWLTPIAMQARPNPDIGDKLTLNNNSIDFSETRIWTGNPNGWIPVDDETGDFPQFTRSVSAIRYWWLRHIKNIPASAISIPSVIEADRICLELVTATLTSSYDAVYPRRVPRYTMDMVTSAEDSNFEMESDFAWQGQVVAVGGVFHFRPGAERASSRTLDVQEEAVSIDAVKVFQELDSITNGLTLTLAQSAPNDWSQLAMRADDSALQNVHPREEAFDLGIIRSVQQPSVATRLMAIALRRARQVTSFSYTIRPGPNFEWLNRIPTDRILINDTENGLTAYPAEIVSMRLTDDWLVRIRVQQAPYGIYADSDVLPPLPDSPIDISDPGDVVIPITLAATSAVVISDDGSAYSAITFTWDEAAVAGTDVRWRLEGTTEWTYGYTTESPLASGPLVGGDYEYQARHISTRLIRGRWTDVATVTVDPDESPPDDPDDFTLAPIPGGYDATWTRSAAADYEYTEILDAPQGSAAKCCNRAWNRERVFL